MSIAVDDQFTHMDDEKVLDFIDAVVRKNQKESAEEVGIARKTVRRMKNKFDDADREERLTYIRDLIDEEL